MITFPTFLLSIWILIKVVLTTAFGMLLMFLILAFLLFLLKKCFLKLIKPEVSMYRIIILTLIFLLVGCAHSRIEKVEQPFEVFQHEMKVFTTECHDKVMNSFNKQVTYEEAYETLSNECVDKKLKILTHGYYYFIKYSFTNNKDNINSGIYSVSYKRNGIENLLTFKSKKIDPDTNEFYLYIEGIPPKIKGAFVIRFMASTLDGEKTDPYIIEIQSVPLGVKI